MNANVVRLSASKGDRRKSGAVYSAARRNRRALLVALRNRIARDVDAGVPARDLASLSRRLMELAREIEAIDARDREGDEIAEASEAPDEAWNGE